MGQLQQVEAAHEDTLLDIARRYGLGYEELRLANPGVDPWLPKEGTPILLPTRYVLPDGPRNGIVLNLAEMRLYYYPKNQRGESSTVVTYPVSIGRGDWETPLGVTHITAKVTKPTWYPPASIRKEHAEQGDPLPDKVPPGPDNPLGDYALRLGLPGYLIHGTNKPYGIGMKVSHGCVRLYPEDISALFNQVAPGTRVRIVNEPYKTGWFMGALMLEAHPPSGQSSGDGPLDLTPLTRSLVAASEGRPSHALDWRLAEEVALDPRGIPLTVALIAPESANDGPSGLLSPESAHGAVELESGAGKSAPNGKGPRDLGYRPHGISLRITLGLSRLLGTHGFGATKGSGALPGGSLDHVHVSALLALNGSNGALRISRHISDRSE